MNHGFHFYEESEICWNTLWRCSLEWGWEVAERLVTVTVCLHSSQDYCGAAQNNGSFRILTENVLCGTTGTTCSKAIKIFVGVRSMFRFSNKPQSKLFPCQLIHDWYASDQLAILIHSDYDQIILHITNCIIIYIIYMQCNIYCIIYESRETRAKLSYQMKLSFHVTLGTMISHWSWILHWQESKCGIYGVESLFFYAHSALTWYNMKFYLTLHIVEMYELFSYWFIINVWSWPTVIHYLAGFLVPFVKIIGEIILVTSKRLRMSNWKVFPCSIKSMVIEASFFHLHYNRTMNSDFKMRSSGWWKEALQCSQLRYARWAFTWWWQSKLELWSCGIRRPVSSLNSVQTTR